MAEAVNDRPEQPENPRTELADLFGAEKSKDVIREALDQAGATPIAENWTARRLKFMRWLDEFEQRVDRAFPVAA